MRDQLGPFQAIWEAWDETNDEMLKKPLSHFQRAVEVQFQELEEHRANGNAERAAREVIDIISVALNCLRWMGYRPEDVARLARSRAESRMKGQAKDILEKYQRLYQI